VGLTKQEFSKTLGYYLTRNLLLWSAGLFAGAFVILAFFLGNLADHLADRIVEEEAHHHLEMQVEGLIMHLDAGDQQAIVEETERSLHDPDAWGAFLVDSNGQLLHAALRDDDVAGLMSKETSNIKLIRQYIEADKDLSLFKAKIPGHDVSLILIMDKSPISGLIHELIVWVIFLLFLLLVAAFVILQLSLRKQVLRPVEKISAELVQSRERFRTLFDSSSDGLFILNMQGDFIDINKTAHERLGYSKEEMLAMKLSELDPPEFAAKVHQRIEKIMKHGMAVFETSHYRKDGSIMPVEINARIIELDGEEVFFSVVRDISERKLSEDQLRKLSQAVEQAGEAVLITDKNGIIEYINPAFTEITGYSSEDAVGNNPSMLRSNAQDPSYYKELWETITRGEVWHGTLVDRKKDGSFYPALMSVSPIHDDSGETTHYVAIQQDMTEHQRLEEQFQQAQKMDAVGTLVGGIAHDFNNMLAGIMGNLYLARLRVECNDNASAIEKLDNIEKLSDRAAEMIRQLLTFARKDVVRMNTFFINPFLNEALKLARSGIPENIRLTYDICSEDLGICGNATQLQQVVMNLLNNARDAVADISEPVIDCKLDVFSVTDGFRKKYPDVVGNSLMHLSVRDNGCGIPRNKLDKIFEPFFTTKGVGTGTGLGLSMVFGVIQGHGGVIEVESEAGKGTAFHIYLPLQDVESQDVLEDASVVVRGHGETILLVDDEEVVRRVGVDVLNALGYRTLAASDGKEAVDVYKANLDSIDLLVIDVVMPKMGGVEAAQKIRELNPEQPILFATGYDKDAALANEGKDMANSATMSKPFTAKAFSKHIDSMLRPMK